MEKGKEEGGASFGGRRKKWENVVHGGRKRGVMNVHFSERRKLSNWGLGG